MKKIPYILMKMLILMMLTLQEVFFKNLNKIWKQYRIPKLESNMTLEEFYKLYGNKNKI